MQVGLFLTNVSLFLRLSACLPAVSVCFLFVLVRLCVCASKKKSSKATGKGLSVHLSVCHCQSSVYLRARI